MIDALYECETFQFAALRVGHNWMSTVGSTVFLLSGFVAVAASRQTDKRLFLCVDSMSALKKLLFFLLKKPFFAPFQPDVDAGVVHREHPLRHGVDQGLPGGHRHQEQ